MANSSNLVLQLLITARDQASDALEGLRARLDNLGGRVAGAAATGFAVLGVAIAAAFKGGFDAATEFETVMARIRVAGVGSADQLNQLAAAARRLGAETGVGAVPAALGLENLVKAGLSANDAIATLPNVINLASGQMLDMGEAADLVVNTVNAFGLSFQDSQRIVDTFAAGANAATTSVQDLRQGIENAGLAARTGGLSLQETIAVINTLKQSGQGASEAGTALNAMLTELGNAASPVRQALLNAGVATGDFDAVLKLLARGGPVTTQVLNAFTDTARTAAGTLANGLPFYRDQVEQLNNIKVSAADGATIMGGTFASSLERLNATGSELWQTLAAPVVPALTESFQTATTFITQNRQAILDWISAGLSPMTQAVDGLRLAWATFTGDQEKAAQIQQQIEERTAAIGRALEGTSNEYSNNTEAARKNAAAVEQVAQTTQQQAEQQKDVAAITQTLSQRSAEYRAAIEQQSRAQGNANAAAEAANAAAQQQARGLGALRGAYEQQAQEVERLIAAKKAGQATDQQVADGQLKLRRAADDYTSAAQAQSQTVERLGQVQAAEAETAAASTATKIAQQQAILELARARGDENAVARASADLARLETQQARETAASKASLAEQAMRALDAKRAEYALTLDSNPAQQTEVRLLEQTVLQRQAEAHAAQAAIPVKEQEQRQQEGLARGLSQLIALRQRETEVMQAQTGANEQIADALQTEAGARLKLAQASGDQQAIDQAQAGVDQAAIDAGYARAASVSASADALKTRKDEVLANALADGKYTLAEADAVKAAEAGATGARASANAAQFAAEANEKAAKAAKEKAAADTKAAAAAKEHAEQTQAAGSLIGSILTGWQNRLGALSDATRQAFNDLMKLTDNSIFAAKNLQNFEDRLKNIEALERLAFKGRDFGLVKWLNETAIKALQLEKAFIGQAQAADTVIAQLEDYGKAGAASANGLNTLILNAESARTNLNLLDDTRLDRLQAGIDRAREAMDALRQSSEDALDAAQRALLQEQGNSAALLELDRKRRELELQQQINDARAFGDQKAIENLQRALDLEQQVFDLKVKKLQADNQSRAASTPQSTHSSSPVKTYALNLSNGEKTLSAITATDPGAFLESLERARRSAI